MMRQKLLKIFVVLSMMLVPSVKAACTYKEQADLNKEVANIKVVYEEVTEKVYSSERYEEEDEEERDSYELSYFKVNILNLSENFYIVATNNIESGKTRYDSSQALGGIISFYWKNLEKVATYTFNVYSSNKTNCKDELYRTIYVTLPRYNIYADRQVCEGSTLAMCNRYVTTEEIPYEDFVIKVKQLSKSNANTNTNSNETSNPVDNNNNLTMYYIVGGAALLIVIGVIVALASKKRNKL